MRVDKFMVPWKKVWKVPATGTIEDALRCLNDHHVGFVAIVDDADQLTGIVTKTNICQAYLAGTPISTGIDTIAAHDRYISVKPETQTADVAKVLIDRHVHHVLVKEGDRVLGITSTFDLAKELYLDSKAFPYHRDALGAE